MREKSAKDIKFDKERQQFNRTIRHLQSTIREKDRQIAVLKDVISERESKLSVSKDWIERLLTYTELEESEMKRIIQSDKTTAGVVGCVNSLLSGFGRF